jgi:hypothetical protein
MYSRSSPFIVASTNKEREREREGLGDVAAPTLSSSMLLQGTCSLSRLSAELQGTVYQ